MRKVSFVVSLLALMMGVIPSHAATQNVTINGVAFGGVYNSPIVQAAKGDSVKVTNADAASLPHTLTFDNPGNLCKSGTSSVACNTGVIAGGANKTIVLSSTIPSGDYPFHCTVHQVGGVSTMHGVLRIP